MAHTGEARVTDRVLRPRSKDHRIGVARLRAGVILAVACGASFAAWQGSPLPAAVVALGLLTMRLAPGVGWLTAWALAVTASSTMVVALLRVTPHVDASLSSSIAAFLSVVVVLAVLEAARPTAISLRAIAVPLAIAASMPTALFVYFIYWNRHTSGTFLVWGMNNDAVSRLVQVRRTVAESGFTSKIAPTDPLTTALNILWSVPGTPSARGDALRHVILREEQIWILIWLATGLTLGAMTVSALSRQPRVVQLVGSILAAALPATWFMSGYSFTYGFQNAGPSVLLLLLAWQMWRASRKHPSASLAGLVLVTVGLVMAWAPLAAVSVALLVAALFAHRTRVVPRTRLQWVGMGVSVVIAVVSAWFAYRDTTANVGALTVTTSPFAIDGPIQAFRYQVPLILAGVGLVIGAVCAVWRRQARSTWLGTFAAVAGASLTCSYLLYTRRDNTELWGYYPIKFTWLFVSAALGVAFVHIAGALARRLGAVLATGGMVAAGAATIGVMLATSPGQPADSSIAAPVGMHRTSAGDYAAQRVLQVYDEHPKSLMAGLSPQAPFADYFVNFWMMHLSVDSSDDSIRGDAYTLDSSSPTAVCATIRHWGPGVRVWTSTREFAAEIRQACSPRALGYSIKIVVPSIGT